MPSPDLLRPGAADASVRPATAADVDAVGAVHSRSWRATYADTLPAEVLGALRPEALAEAWRGAVTSAPSPQHRVLVACSGPTVVGFVATAPAGTHAPPGEGAPQDPGAAPGAELVALHVDPAHQRLGHGSRLLHAAVDHARQDGAVVLTAWCAAVDEARRVFLTSAGLGPDGGWRELAVPGSSTGVREVRLVASLADPA